MEEFSTAAQRISAFVKHLGLSENEWRQDVGWSQGLLGKAARGGGPVGSDKLESVLRKYPELNADWVLTGRGTIDFRIEAKNSKKGEENFKKLSNFY